MARSIRTIVVKALFGREQTASREEFNKLVDEVDEIKTKLAAHTHTGVTTGAGVSGAASTITYANAEAKKIG